MKEFPKGGLIGKVMDAAKTVKQMHIPLHAAYAAYFIILAFFPALVLILSVLRYTGMEVRGLVELLGDILPSTMVGDAEELIYSTYRNSSGALVGVSAVTALWSASRGIYGMLTGLNAVYGVSENRGYIYYPLHQCGVYLCVHSDPAADVGAARVRQLHHQSHAAGG